MYSIIPKSFQNLYRYLHYQMIENSITNIKKITIMKKILSLLVMAVVAVQFAFAGDVLKSDELFSANAVTVVNFWFTTCNPCVGELSELDALNKKLAEKGGSLIGVNTFTLDGDETAISEAKVVLAKKGATYQNVYFDSDGEAGKFTTNIFAYPTTYVVDRSGNIVGEPIVGAITEKKQAETLQKLIDQALAADMG